MIIDIKVQQSWNEIQWLDSESDYLAHLNILATKAFPAINDLVNSINHEKWEEGIHNLNLVVQDLCSAFYLEKNSNAIVIDDSIDHPRFHDPSKYLANTILKYIRLFEKYKLIESGHFVEVDIGIIAQIVLKKEFDSRFEALYLKNNILYPPYTIFGYDNTRKMILNEVGLAPKLAMKNLLALVGYNKNLIQNFLLDFNSDERHDLVSISANDLRNSPPSVIVENRFNDAFQTLRVGNKSRISFHRTLRIPEDGRDYPLPASLGTLPIHRVEDFADSVPARWLEQGGFFIPLYQKEALFIQFDGEDWCPSIAKVCVGGINAITGKEHSDNLFSHSQDYVVIPTQKWLDGINSGDGIVRQFVAMPLGLGYTIEAQFTDEERQGGFQLTVYEPVEGRFQKPIQSPLRKAEFIKRLALLEFDSLFNKLNRRKRAVIESIKNGALASKAAFVCALSNEEVIETYNVFIKTFYKIVEDKTKHYFGNDPQFHSIFNQTVKLLKNLGLRGPIEPDSIDPTPTRISEPPDQSSLRLYSSAAPAPTNTEGRPAALGSSPGPESSHQQIDEMGIAAGGKIKQQIYRDPFGIECWDYNKRRLVRIHIVNSVAYKAITGRDPLPSPITSEHYQNAGIPWFSHYDEHAECLQASGILNKIMGISAIDRRRGAGNVSDAQPLNINPLNLQRIRTPDLNEVIEELRTRARQEMDTERWVPAIKQIDRILDLGSGDSGEYMLRSKINYYLGNYTDGMFDGDKALEIHHDNLDARYWRSRCRLELGDFDGAEEDAHILISNPETERLGITIQAEALFRRSKFHDAFNAAFKGSRLYPDDEELKGILDKSGIESAKNAGEAVL
jgi:hypothetical protein